MGNIKTQVSSVEQKLELVRSLQNKYPDLYLGGSLALLMYGIDLRRDGRDIGDLDFNKIRDEIDLVPGATNRYEDDMEGDKDSIEMTYRLEYKGESIDIEINKFCDCEYIGYKGNEYKVASIHTILGKKFKYALKGTQKHIDDIKYLLDNNITLIS